MKKLFILLLGLCLALTACAKDAGQEAYEPEGTVQALVASGAFSVTLEELEASLLYDFSGYGLDEERLANASARSASGYAEQVSVTVWETEEDAEAALTAFTDYLQDRKDTYKSYAPAEVGKLENAIVNRRGTSVLLVVPNDVEAAKAAVERLDSNHE